MNTCIKYPMKKRVIRRQGSLEDNGCYKTRVIRRHRSLEDKEQNSAVLNNHMNNFSSKIYIYSGYLDQETDSYDLMT